MATTFRSAFLAALPRLTAADTDAAALALFYYGFPALTSRDLLWFSTTFDEQPRTITRNWITGVVGTVDRETMAEVDVWLRDILSLH